MIERSEHQLTRRAWLRGAATVAATAAGPFVWTRPASGAGKVVIRTIGGSYEEANVKAIFEPFTKATGIEVVKVPASLGKLLAMFESGNIELDIVDAGELGLLSLNQKGALDKINYKAWKLTNPEDMDHRRDTMVADIYFSTVLGYNTQVFPTGKHPKSWAEFWDLKRFPGPRMLTDLAAGAIDVEFALLADGVPKDKLYPIDLDRAFKSLDRVRPAIRKMLGRADVVPPPLVATLGGDVGAGTARRRFVPARTSHDGEGRLVATPVPFAGSGDVFGFAAADALIVVPENAPRRAAGERAHVVPLGDAR